MQAQNVNSSWVAKVAYLPSSGRGLPGFLVVRSQTGEVYVWAAPSWVAGLLMAAQAQGRSVGRLFNRLRPRLTKLDNLKNDEVMMYKVRKAVSL